MRQSPKETVLVVCSDSVTRSVLQDVLASDGYIVLTASGIGGAVETLRQSTPDLLIVRPYIEHMSGAEAAKYLRTKSHGIPVLVVGGFLDDDRLRFRDSLQNLDIFPKPYPAAELLGKVRDVLQRVTASAPAAN